MGSTGSTIEVRAAHGEGNVSLTFHDEDGESHEFELDADFAFTLAISILEATEAARHGADAEEEPEPGAVLS